MSLGLSEDEFKNSLNTSYKNREVFYAIVEN